MYWFMNNGIAGATVYEDPLGMSLLNSNTTRMIYN